MKSNTNNTASSTQNDLSNVEQDIIASYEMNKLAVLDEIENKLDMIEGSLNFAIANANNKGFYLGLNEHVKSVVNLLDKLRK